MSKKINIIIGAVIFFILVLFSLSFSAEEEGETFTITTYYPSPYGVYKELRLYPNTSPNPCDSNSNNKGAMYYNDSDNQVYVCNGTAWKTLGSGCPDVPGANQNNCWLDVDGELESVPDGNVADGHLLRHAGENLPVVVLRHKPFLLCFRYGFALADRLGGGTLWGDRFQIRPIRS